MHYVRLIREILEAALALVPAATNDRAGRLAKVRMRWHPLSGVDADHFAEDFALAANASIGYPVALEIVRESASASCDLCGSLGEVAETLATCPACGHFPLTLEGAGEFVLDEIEIADPGC
ncbi:MAG: hydrogenase maturation nickel metallochaperone HypA [Planctomycetes bacterium]|nr:hydrogenase maturation nickel metallochaperone HypA [Planctomycetota bacterium]